jgi:predicted alpha/beta hydrolase
MPQAANQPQTNSSQASPAQPIGLVAPDGYPLGGHCWPATNQDSPVVVINAATSVVSRYYARFAAYLHQHGLHVITYDYRGIGLSRHGSLKDLSCGWLDWGELDCEAALLEAKRRFPDSPVLAVGHSVGGVLFGLAPSNHLLSRVFTMGAQHAYWPDYQASARWLMRWRWHVVMPTLTRLFGYFPGKRLGWLEDTPAGVVRDWVAPCPDFIDTYAACQRSSGSRQLSPSQCEALRARFKQVNAPILALSVTDDPFGTVPAIERLLSHFKHSETTHLRITPNDHGVAAIGHFGYFHSRFEPNLWPIALQWLQNARVSCNPYPR